MADPKTTEDEQRIDELLAMDPALLQPEAIELREEVKRLHVELAAVLRENNRLSRNAAQAECEAARHLEHLRIAFPRHFTPNVIGQRLCGCDGQWPCREHLRLTEDQAFAVAAIDAWQDGTTAPQDVLAAIRDRLGGRTADQDVRARNIALEQLAERYSEAFAELLTSAKTRITKEA